MKNMIANMKKRKGFTLVEVIIVLVIIAILAAVLIPSLTGYIDKANQKVAVTNARNFTMAAQTIASEMYGTSKKVTKDTAEAKTFISDAMKLAELDSSFKAQVKMGTDCKITEVKFYDGTYEVTYSGGEFKVVGQTTVPNNLLTLGSDAVTQS